MHCHLDLVGGISGDMFIGAVLDAYPELESTFAETLEAAGFTDLVNLESRAADDGTLTGTHFTVIPAGDAEGHHHRHYSDIRRIIGESALAEPVRQRALDIFHIIAVAEAEIHGKSVDDVAFHEVGAWDSIADVLCAASLIESLNATWSVSRLPRGGGQVKTAHGMLPVPAPATALILAGFEFFDDGVQGERITPTGAAILKHLSPDQRTPGANLERSGFGFGTKRFPGLSNVARLLVFETQTTEQWGMDQVLQLEFEVDDQTAEELAWALDELRSTEGVIDVIQLPALGKKGRQMTSVRLLAQPSYEQAVTERCFALTTTLGIRRQLISRTTLTRREEVLDTELGSIRVKLADRPGGVTAKADNDDLVAAQSLEERRRLRDAVEQQSKKNDDD